MQHISKFECDSDLEGDLLPGLADFICDWYSERLETEQFSRMERIQVRMSADDYFDTPESAADLEWLKALIAALEGTPNA